MAANNGRQGGGGGGGGGNMNEHVEFSVKAEEDLYLQGSETTIKRVTAETNYSCLMLKTQRFSSLFRHYAKYHGLRKDELEYYFVNLLENEDTPETVQLQRGDTIMVRKKRKAEPPEAAADDEEYFHDMKELLDDDAHMDAVFLVPAKKSLCNSSNRIKEEDDEDDDDMEVDEGHKLSNNQNTIRIRAHKSVLTARADYFKSFFRNHGSSAGNSTSGSASGKPKSKKGSSKKSSAAAAAASENNNNLDECFIPVDPLFNERHIRYVLEFIYTNRITDIRSISLDDLLSILHLSDKWNLRDLKRLVEHALIRDHMRVETVARLYGATEDFTAKRLCKACTEYILANLRQLAGNHVFEEEMKNYPHLCTMVLKAAADMIPDGPAHKKQRTSDLLSGGGTPSSAAAAFRSSPVPDSDT